MSKTRSLWVALVGIVLLASWVYAQEGEAPPREDRPRARGPRRGARQTLARLYEQMVRELQLTAEQQPRVRQMIDTHLQALENWTKEFGPKLQELRQQVAAAAREQNREKANELRQQMGKLWQARGELRQKLNQQILGILTGEQKEKFQQLVQRAAAVARGQRGRVVLTPRQRQELAKILKTAAEKANQAGTPQGKEAVWDKAVEDVLQFITRARTAGPRDRPGARGLFGQLNLTEDQRQQVEKILADAQEKARGADREGRRNAYRDANQKIETEVLTPAQVEQLRKLREQRRQAGRRGERRGRARPGGEAAE